MILVSFADGRLTLAAGKLDKTALAFPVKKLSSKPLAMTSLAKHH
jgi:hypothetical protein